MCYGETMELQGEKPHYDIGAAQIKLFNRGDVLKAVTAESRLVEIKPLKRRTHVERCSLRRAGIRSTVGGASAMGLPGRG